jgi:hypothetical protein
LKRNAGALRAVEELCSALMLLITVAHALAHATPHGAVHMLTDKESSASPLSCTGSTPSSISVAFDPIPATDLYYVAVVDGGGRAAGLVTVPGDVGLDCRRDASGACAAAAAHSATLGGLRAGSGYTLVLRSHPSSAPSIVWGWRNETVNATCHTRPTDAPRGASARLGGSRRLKDLEPLADALDAPRAASSKFTRVYRVSELIYEVDFLANHDSADLQGQTAFLSSGSADGTPAFARLPVTEYCVEHVDRPFAPYISCNGPEASPRRRPTPRACATCTRTA